MLCVCVSGTLDTIEFIICYCIHMCHWSLACTHTHTAACDEHWTWQRTTNIPYALTEFVSLIYWLSLVDENREENGTKVNFISFNVKRKVRTYKIWTKSDVVVRCIAFWKPNDGHSLSLSICVFSIYKDPTRTHRHRHTMKENENKSGRRHAYQEPWLRSHCSTVLKSHSF